MAQHPTPNRPAVPDTQQKAESVDSGSYDPGPVEAPDAPSAEISYVQSQRNDLMPEEFPDGPYGAASDPERLGKSSPWRPGQRSVSAYRDQNPVDSDRQTPVDEPAAGAPEGSIEGQN